MATEAEKVCCLLRRGTVEPEPDPVIAGEAVSVLRGFAAHGAAGF
jgi:hypothetical protein